jgi:hypothetical protein
MSYFSKIAELGKFKSAILMAALFSLAIFGAGKAQAGSAIISWNANTESDLAGYKLYYGTSHRNCSHPDANNCGYTTELDVHNVTNHIVDNLPDGQTYYFAVTAYDTSSNESDFSTEGSRLITAEIEGDIIRNHRVDLFDYNAFITNFGNATCGNIADIEINCHVDIFDYNTLIMNFGRSS